LSQADRKIGELAGTARRLPNPHLLIRPFVNREAVLSSRIEGTQAEVADLYAYEVGQRVLPGIRTPAPEQDVREVNNYVKALDYGVERARSIAISQRLLKELHGRLLEGVRGHERTPGEYRQQQNWIGPVDCAIEDARYIPPSVPEMRKCLDELEVYLNSDDPRHPPLVRLALAHYQFEAIHPFVDVNGRIGRLLLILLLVHWGLLPHPLLYLSAYFERHRLRYYDLLRDVSDRGGWHAWIVFFLKAVAAQASEALVLATSLQDLQSAWRTRFTGTGGSSGAIQLVDSLFERPILTIPLAQSLLGVSYPAAKNTVEKLVAAGILTRVAGASNPKVYVAADIMRLVRTSPRRDQARSLQTPGSKP
jgi:Fic family protein